jgi:hypothetical protein
VLHALIKLVTNELLLLLTKLILGTPLRALFLGHQADIHSSIIYLTLVTSCSLLRLLNSSIPG